MNKLSGNEKKIIDKQNNLISDFIINKYQEVPFDISRDSSGRAIVLVGSSTQPEIYAKMLGTNNRKKPVFINVGRLLYHFVNENEMNIDSLVVLKNFRNSDIGKIMLQGTENFAADSGIKKISANLVTNDGLLSENDGSLVYGKDLLPIKFDPTLYLFLTNNFVKVAPKNSLDLTNRVENRKPKRSNIHYGVNPKSKKDKTDIRFKPLKPFGNMEIHTPYYIPNSLNATRFEPLYLYPNENSLNNLSKLVIETPQNEQNNS